MNTQALERAFDAAERARIALMVYHEAISALPSHEDAALVHQVITQSSSMFKGALKKIDAHTKYALEFIEQDQFTESTTIRGFQIPSMDYKPVQSPSAEIMDKGDKAWGAILRAASEVNSNAIQRRLSTSAFIDPKTGEQLMTACSGLVGIKLTKTVSITKR